MRNSSTRRLRVVRWFFIAAVSLFACTSHYQTASVAFAGTDSTDPEVNKLGEQLKSDDPEERTAARLKLPALGQRVQPLLPQLVELLTDEKWTQVGNIQTSIANHDMKILGELGPIATDAMIDALHDSRKPVRLGTAEVLGRLHDPKAVEPLVKLLGDEDRELAGRAMSSLENLGDLSVDALIAATKSERVQVRYIAASALGHIQLPRVVHPIVCLLNDPEKFPRENAAEALANLSVNNPNSGWNPANKVFDQAAAERIRAENHAEIRNAIFDELISTLHGSNSDARLAALKAAYRVVIPNGPPNYRSDQTDQRTVEMRNTLATCMADADPAIRKQATSVISLIHDPEVLPPLVMALHDADADVRAQAANGLRYRLESFHQFEDAKFVEPLTAALGDADKRVRTSAAEALARINSKSKSSAAPALAKLLSDPEPEVANAAIQALVPMGSAVAANPIAELLENPTMRARAAAALADMKDPRAIGVLRAELVNKNPNVIGALGILQDRESVAPLINLLDEKDENIQRSAIEALAAIGDPRAVDPLLRHLTSNPNSIRTIADALGKLGDPRAIKPMIQAAPACDAPWRFNIEQQPHRPIDNPVAWSLVHFGFQAVEPLAEALKDPSEIVRGVAASALFEMRYNSDLCDKEDLQPAADSLAAALNDSSEFVRTHAAITLGYLGDARATRALLQAITAADQSDYVGSHASSCLSDLHDPKTFEPLLQLLADQRSEVRKSAAYALIGFHDPHAIEPLVTLLNDSEPTVREAAAQALGFHKAEKEAESLVGLLSDSDATVRIDAAQALGRIGQANAIEPLAMLLEEQDVKLRTAAAVALVRLNDPRGLEAVRKCLAIADPKQRETAVIEIRFSSYPKCEALAKQLSAAVSDPALMVRVYAADELGQIGTREAVDALLAKLDDKENLARFFKAGASKDERAIEPLVRHLNNADPQVRNWAAAALANFAAEKSASPLLAHLNDSSPEVRIAIIDALARIHPQSGTYQLKALADDSDPKIRAHAARALKRVKQ